MPGSPEARERTRHDARFETFDGVSMPFDDGSFDLVYCKQVLEHVRHPEPLLAEVRRVLAARRLVRRLHLAARALPLAQPVELHPVRIRRTSSSTSTCARSSCALASTGPTLIAWRLAGGHRCFHRWWGRESPLNRALNACGRALQGRRAHAKRHQAAVLRPVRLPGPARGRRSMTISEPEMRVRAARSGQPARPPQPRIRPWRPTIATWSNGSSDCWSTAPGGLVRRPSSRSASGWHPGRHLFPAPPSGS